MSTVSPPKPDAPKPDVMGLILRVGLFILIGWMGLIVFSLLLYPLAGVMITSAMTTFAAAAVANAITVRIYERGRLSDLGLGWEHSSAREFLIGAAVGAAAGVVVLVVPLLTGSAFFEQLPPQERVEHPLGAFAFVTIVLLFGAFGEEMLFHGYAFQLLIRRLGAFATILPAAVIFGMAHMGNPNSTGLSVINTILWGVLFGYAYVRTGALWLPIGLHFGWNFALPLFGVNLSGFTMGVTGYELHWRPNALLGGALWSGGNYGPEGSILTAMIVVVLFFVLVRVVPDRERGEL